MSATCPIDRLIRAEVLKKLRRDMDLDTEGSLEASVQQRFFENFPLPLEREREREYVHVHDFLALSWFIHVGSESRKLTCIPKAQVGPQANHGLPDNHIHGPCVSVTTRITSSQARALLVRSSL